MSYISEDMRRLARRHLREAKVLLKGEEWSGAYYLSGYAVECGLKACALKSIRPYHMPDDKDLLKKLYTHKLEDLITIAELTADLNASRRADPQFGLFWQLVSAWSESSRYQTTPELLARDMVKAVGEPGIGVLPWIIKRWK